MSQKSYEEIAAELTMAWMDALSYVAAQSPSNAQVVMGFLQNPENVTDFYNKVFKTTANLYKTAKED